MDFLFASGQVALNPATGELELSSIQAETHQVMKNVLAVLDAAGLTIDHVVKTTIFLSDMGLFAQVNEVYGSYFSDQYPARETVAVKGLPRGKRKFRYCSSAIITVLFTDLLKAQLL